MLRLATSIVQAANSRPDDRSGLKVGGQQASSASMVGVLTTLWSGRLTADDRVGVKPHASPVFHALSALLGRLDAAHLPRLREYGGLQPYPSRTKDPDTPDYSTGSVGIGATAPACLGVQEFGQAGSLTDVQRHHGIDARAVVEAVLDLRDV